MSSSKPLVIVLSRNYSTGLGVIRSLGAAGYTVDLIASTKKKGSSRITSSSKYVRRCTEVISPRIQDDDGGGIVEALMQYAGCQDGAVLFPTDDFTTKVLAANDNLLRSHFVMPHIVGGNGFDMLRAMDKSFQSGLARQCGLRVPAQWMVSLKDHANIPKDIVYPCFVKPMQSVSGRKSEMKKCDSPAQLAEHLAEMARYYDDRSVIIQEYLNIDREYDFSGVCLEQEVIIPAVLKKRRVSMHERGVTMVAEMMPTAELGDALPFIYDMLSRMHYVGMFDMEVNLCRDKLYFGEINMRSGGPNYAYCLSGANLPEITVGELTGNGHSGNHETVDSFGSTFVYEKIAWEDYIHSHISRQELKQCIKDSDYTLLANDDDPVPGRIFKRRIILSAMKHRLLMAIGKE